MKLWVVVMSALSCAVSVPAANAASCGGYSSCAEAVKAWCSGRHPGADRDRDGIPCENVCRSKQQVMGERQKINCVHK